MKKSITKLMAALLSVAMLVTMLPVVSLADSTAPAFEIGTGSNGTYDPASPAVTLAQVAEIGGKSDGDYAAAYVYNADTELASSVRWQWPLSHLTDIGTGGGKNPLYFAFNIYADGDATAVVGYGAGHKFLRWEPDGNLYVDKQGTETLWGTLERGKWHRVALSFNEDGGRFRYYVDGVYTGMNSSWGAITGKSTLNFCLWEGSGNGVVAFDDPTHQLQTKYSDVATTDAATIAAYADDYLKIDTDANHVEYDSLTYTTASALKTALQTATSAQYVELFADSSCATALDDNDAIPETATAVIVPSTGYRYNYYSVGARELTDMEKVKLAKNSDDPDDYKDNWMIYNVNITDDCVAVYSHTTDDDWKISSEELIATIYSENDYILSYVDSKKQNAEANSVIDGYIKAVKDNETIYIPIVNRLNYHTGTSTDSSVKNGLYQKRNYNHTKIDSATNVAGNKSSAFGYSVKDATTTSEGRWDVYYINEDGAYAPNGTSQYTSTYTMVYNMYAEGNAVLGAGFAGGYYLFRWDKNGDVYIVDRPSGTYVQDSTPVCNLARGRWHTVAFTVDRGSGHINLYLDGEQYSAVGTDYITSWNNCYGMTVALNDASVDTATSTAYSSDDIGARVLLSDVEYYEGFYYPDNQFVTAKSATSDFLLDTADRVIYYDNISDVTALKAAITANTDAASVTVYNDNTFAAEATELDNSKNVVILTAANANANRFEYYTLKAMSELPAPEFTFEHSTYVFNATADITKADETLTMYVASYNAENKLLAIQVATIPTGQNISKTVKCAYGDSDAAFVKAFLWTANQTPVGYGYSEVPASAE